MYLSILVFSRHCFRPPCCLYFPVFISEALRIVGFPLYSSELSLRCSSGRSPSVSLHQEEVWLTSLYRLVARDLPAGESSCLFALGISGSAAGSAPCLRPDSSSACRVYSARIHGLLLPYLWCYLGQTIRAGVVSVIRSRLFYPRQLYFDQLNGYP